MKVFLSSTFKDLEQYRAAVITRLRKLDGVQVRCMEDFGARTGSPKEFCLSEARECDLFIGVIGHLYGFVPDGDDTSITEQEYQGAERAGKHMLLFVAPDDFPVPAKLLRGDSNPDKQDAFRALVLSRTIVDLSWSTPETLAAGVVAAVHNWQMGRTSSVAALAATPGIDLTTYAQRCRKRWEAVDLTALAAPGALDGDVELPRLSQVFIPQACRRSRPAMSLPRDYLEKQGLDPDTEERLLAELRERWLRQERLPALELLAKPDARKLVLLGDPGAGKSSLTRFVLLRLLDPATSGTDWQGTLGGIWPMLVELRDLLAREAENRCGDLVSYLAYTGETQGFGFDRAALEAQLRSRPSLIIVDGLDEIFSLPRRRAMMEEIVGLETRFPLARVLVTSRLAGFDAKPFEEAGFALATLDDLDSEQIRLFADTWFSLAFPGEPEKATRARNDLLETLERRPQLAVLAGNPLILTIMAIIARHKRLARSRTQLYAQALDVLCYGWDYKRGLKLPSDSPLADLQPDDTLLILRRIAWRMQESANGLRANAIGEAELREILNDFFADEWRFAPPKARRAATDMVDLLHERNWILTTRGPELYGFVHRTFLEYLCALELTKRFEAQEITLEALRDIHVLPRVDDDSYAEVIRLLCGQLPPRTADQLIQSIAPIPTRSHFQEERLLLVWQSLGELDPRGLAAASASCGVALAGLYHWLQECDFTGTDGWRKIEEAVNTIEPGSWTAGKIVNGKFPFYDAFIPLASAPVIRALAKSIWLPDEALKTKLFSLVDSTEWAERRGAISSITMSQEKGIFDILRRFVVEDESEEVRSEAAQALAETFAEHPEIFELLSTRACEDDSWKVRSEAVQGLARAFAHRPETFELLSALSNDSEIEVSITAVRALTQTYFERPETFDLLQAWLEADSEWVRGVAVQTLAQAFADRPQAFELLRTKADTEDSEWVRSTAVRMLAQTFATHTETFQLLRMWANDNSAGVRVVACRMLAQSFPERPETLEILLDRLDKDDTDDVREEAVRQLCDSFSESPEVFDLLLKLIDEDLSDSARASSL